MMRAVAARLATIPTRARARASSTNAIKQAINGSLLNVKVGLDGNLPAQLPLPTATPLVILRKRLHDRGSIAVLCRRVGPGWRWGNGRR
jgi:hypothetical protein